MKFFISSSSNQQNSNRVRSPSLRDSSLEPFIILINLCLSTLIESSLHCCHASLVISTPVAILIVGQPFLDENIVGIICLWDTVILDVSADGVVFGACHNFMNLDAILLKDDAFYDCVGSCDGVMRSNHDNFFEVLEGHA